MSSSDLCPPGYYCPLSAVYPSPCPVGTFSPNAEASSANTCVSCIAGQYCPQASPRSIPCPAGSFYAGFNATQASDCLQCAPDNFSPSGASLCTRCSDGQTSKAGAASCDVVSCIPSAIDPDKFKCYSDLAKAGVIIGYIFSFFSFLFSVYKARVFVRERVQRLQAASIKPTLKRVLFVERALANHSKRMLLPLADHCSTLPFRFTGPGNGAGALGESESGSDVAGNTVRDLQRQVAQLQEHHEQQLQQLRQEMQQQQQQQQQLHEQQLQQLRQEMQQQKQQQQQQHHEQQLQQLRQDIFQLTQQLQRLQQ